MIRLLIDGKEMALPPGNALTFEALCDFLNFDEVEGTWSYTFPLPPVGNNLDVWQLPYVPEGNLWPWPEKAFTVEYAGIDLFTGSALLKKATPTALSVFCQAAAGPIGKNAEDSLKTIFQGETETLAADLTTYHDHPAICLPPIGANNDIGNRWDLGAADPGFNPVPCLKFPFLIERLMGKLGYEVLWLESLGDFAETFFAIYKKETVGQTFNLSDHVPEITLKDFVFGLRCMGLVFVFQNTAKRVVIRLMANMPNADVDPLDITNFVVPDSVATDANEFKPLVLEYDKAEIRHTLEDTPDVYEEVPGAEKPEKLTSPFFPCYYDEYYYERAQGFYVRSSADGYMGLYVGSWVDNFQVGDWVQLQESTPYDGVDDQGEPLEEPQFLEVLFIETNTKYLKLDTPFLEDWGQASRTVAHPDGVGSITYKGTVTDVIIRRPVPRHISIQGGKKYPKFAAPPGSHLPYSFWLEKYAEETGWEPPADWPHISLYLGNITVTIGGQPLGWPMSDNSGVVAETRFKDANILWEGDYAIVPQLWGALPSERHNFKPIEFKAYLPLHMLEKLLPLSAFTVDGNHYLLRSSKISFSMHGHGMATIAAWRL